MRNHQSISVFDEGFSVLYVNFFINPYVGNIHFTVKTMYHILQNVRNSGYYIRILFVVTDDYSIQLADSSLYHHCTARTCKGTIRTRSLKSLKVAKVINL